MTDLARSFPTGVTILRMLAIVRWLAWGWMVAVVAFSGDAVRHPVVAWLAVIAGLALATVSTWWMRSSPGVLLTPAFVAVEGAYALALTVLDGWVFEPGHVFVTSQNLASQWPLIAAISIGVAAGPFTGAAFGLLIGPARWAGAELNGFESYDPKHVVSLVAVSLFYAACGAVFGWLAMLLRRAEREIADRRARDEVARVLHDTVLQTLALVERRTAATDPELAGAAREADHDLRAFLFGGAGSAGDDLRGRLLQAVEHARQRVAVPAVEAPRISVNVVDDGCRLSGNHQDLLARAIGEAVANALEHARARTIVVFAETDDDGQVFASVRDDGIGFDPGRSDTWARAVRVDRRAAGVDRRPFRRAQHVGRRDRGASLDAPMTAIRVVLADDHAVVRAGLRAELGDGFDVVGEADDAEGAIDVITARRPDLVVCDLHMPRGGGLHVVERCATVCPIVILTVSEAERDLLDAVAAGAAGYLLKTAPTDEVRDALVRAAAGEPVFSPSLAGLVLGEFRRLARTTDASPLTEREREVLQLVARGHRYAEIGVELSISPKTAENHVRNILGKLHLTRRSDLVRYAVRHGID